MPLKRSLAVASAISAAVILGALAAGAVNGISNYPHNAGEYSAIDPSRSGPNSGQGGADPSSNIDAGNGASSAPDLATASGVSLTSGANPVSRSRTSNSAGRPIVNGSSASSSGGAGTANPPPGPEAPVTTTTSFPATTTTSFDDHGGDGGGGHGSDDPLDD